MSESTIIAACLGVLLGWLARQVADYLKGRVVFVDSREDRRWEA